MLIGEYYHTVDTKGRMSLPAKFRQVFKSGAVITRGLDNCLFIYPKKDWQKLATKLAALPISQAKTRAFARLMLAGAMDVEIDRQGRVVLPEYLRKYANLKMQLKNMLLHFSSFLTSPIQYPPKNQQTHF